MRFSKKQALIGAAVATVLAVLVGLAVGLGGGDGGEAGGEKPAATPTAGESPRPTPGEKNSSEAPSEAPPEEEEPGDNLPPDFKGPSTTPTPDPGAPKETEQPRQPTPPAVEGAEAIFYTNYSGGASPYYPVACGLSHVVAEAKESDADAYSGRITKGRTVVSDASSAFPQTYGLPGVEVNVACGDLKEGEEYTFTVEGKGYRFSTDFTHAVTRHPGAVETSAKLEGDTPVIRAGKPVRFTYSDGEWADGTLFKYRVWTSKTKDFTPEDFTANSEGKAAILRGQEDTPVIFREFVPMARDRGRYAWISIVAQEPGKAPYVITFEPHRVR